MPIHPYPTSVSITIMFPNRSSLVPIDFPTATIFALPPIQLPDRAPNPIQASEGKKDPNTRRDKGPPMIIPNVPNNMVPIAFGPKAASAFIFDDNNKRINAGGSKCFVVHEYKIELSGMIPILVLIIGKKYTHITGGIYLNKLSKADKDFK